MSLYFSRQLYLRTPPFLSKLALFYTRQSYVSAKAFTEHNFLYKTYPPLPFLSVLCDGAESLETLARPSNTYHMTTDPEALLRTSKFHEGEMSKCLAQILIRIARFRRIRRCKMCALQKYSRPLLRVTRSSKKLLGWFHSN